LFGLLKLHYGMAQARYLGKARNQIRFSLMCLAYNLKRGVSLQKEIQCLQDEVRLKNGIRDETPADWVIFGFILLKKPEQIIF
jgi:hypothetical protein